MRHLQYITKKINSIFLIILFSNVMLMSMIEPSEIQNTNSSEPYKSDSAQLLPPYQDQRITELGNWKEKLGDFDNILVSDTYAYATGGDNTLAVINISDTYNPEAIGHIDTTGSYSNHIYKFNNYLIISEGARGFEIIDISNKTAPIDIFYKYLSSTQETIMYNQYLLVADLDVDIRIFDAHDLTNLNQIAYLSDGTQGAYSIEIVDHYVVVADGYEGLEIIDIQDIFNPIEVGEYSITNGSYFTDVIVENYTAYVLNDENNLLLFNLSDMENPTLMNIYNGSAYESLAVKNEIVYLKKLNGGFDVVNCSNPVNITYISSYITDSTIQDMQVNGSTIYLADLKYGFKILNATNISNITVISQFGGSYFHKMILNNDYAYLLDYLGYLVILDVSNWNDIKKISDYYFPNNTYGLFVQDTVVFITVWSYGLFVLNSTNKYNPNLISSYNYGGNTTDVYVVEDRAYVTDIQNNLLILNISNLASPSLLNTINLIDTPVSIQVTMEYAYLTCLGNYFIKVNINESSTFYTNELSFDIEISGMESITVFDYSYIATHTLTILRIYEDVLFFSDETDTGTVLDLSLINNNYLLTSGITSIQIFDIREPSVIYPAAAFYDIGVIEDIHYNDGLVYILNSENEFDFEITVFDSDSDGLFDYEEFSYGTNPFDEDTDYDGLSDYDEIIVYNSNPFSQDSDLDGLLDGDEVNLYQTNPNKQDTDGDGHSDYDEVIEGTDPLNPLSFPVKRDWVIYTVIIVAFLIISGYLILRIRKNIK